MMLPVHIFPKKIIKISAFVLMAYLWAFITHAQHYDLTISLGEIQQCQLCQSTIDTPPESPLAAQKTLVAYAKLVTPNVEPILVALNYQRPYLRAPPVIH